MWWERPHLNQLVSRIKATVSAPGVTALILKMDGVSCHKITSEPPPTSGRDRLQLLSRKAVVLLNID
jgi:hypothetical protein